MSDLRLYRLWRTSAILCSIGGAEFAYLAWSRHAWWPLIAMIALVTCAGLAFRRARESRGPR
jgi:hypothetical protein